MVNRKYFLYIISLLILITVTSMTAFGDSIEDLETGAKDAYIKGDYEGAIKYYDEILSIVSQDSDKGIEVLYEKGKAYLNLNKYDEAIECFNIILGYRPDRTDIKELKESVENSITEKPVNLILPEMVLIHGGTFNMGCENGSSDEKPVHSVTLKSFYMGKYEVTNSEFCVFLNSVGNYEVDGKLIFEKSDGIRGGRGPGSFDVVPGYEDFPVVNITWYGAERFCQWLKTNTGEKYRLPSEAEWEYACRGGADTLYYWGNEMNGDYCWYNDNSDKGIHKKGEKLPNAFGLYDMTGNVWEWCNDDYGLYSADGTMVNKGSSRVLRGGCFSSAPYYCRVSARYFSLPVHYDYNTGFRVVKD